MLDGREGVEGTRQGVWGLTGGDGSAGKCRCEAAGCLSDRHNFFSVMTSSRSFERMYAGGLEAMLLQIGDRIGFLVRRSSGVEPKLVLEARAGHRFRQAFSRQRAFPDSHGASTSHTECITA